MKGIEIGCRGGLVYKCVKEVVIHRYRKRYSFVIGKTYPVVKEELFVNSVVYRYLIKHPEGDLIIAPLFLDSFFSRVEKEELK